MTPRLAALLGLIGLLSGTAAGDPPGSQQQAAEEASREAPINPPTGRAGLSQQLDQFVSRAIDARLLRSASNADVLAEPGYGANARAVAQASSQPCGREDPFDFSAVETLVSFADLARFETELPGGEPRSRKDRVRALISLGLYSEASGALKDLPVNEAEPLIQLARLMDRRHFVDGAYFADLANCHGSAGLWLGVALVADGQKAGARLLSDQMSHFRKLPLHLRADVALISIPALAEFGERELMSRVLAAFPERDVQTISRLKFCRAIVDLSEGKPDAAMAVRSFLIKPEFEVDALSALRRHNEPLSPVQRAVLAEDLTRIVSQQTSMRQIAFATNFALDEMDATANYDMVFRIGSLPALQLPAAREEIQRRVATALRRDLEGEDPLRKLIAIDVLIAREDFLAGNPQLDELYDLAWRQANGMGRKALSIQLAEKSGRPSRLAEEQAAAAFLGKDDQALLSISNREAANQQVLFYAAMRAVQLGDAARLNVLEPSLQLNPKTLVTLIEEDALTQKWVVPDRFYDAARQLTDAEDLKKVNRVLAIRGAAKVPSGETTARSIGDVDEALNRSRQALAALNAETP